MELDDKDTEELIRFSCSHCQAPLTVEAELAGITGPCPSCGQPMTAPGAKKEEQKASKSLQESLSPPSLSKNESRSPIPLPKPKSGGPSRPPIDAKAARIDPFEPSRSKVAEPAPRLPKVAPEKGEREKIKIEKAQGKTKRPHKQVATRENEVCREREEIGLVIRALFLGSFLFTLFATILWFLRT